MFLFNWFFFVLVNYKKILVLKLEKMFDCIIVGVGLVGGIVVYYLVKKGCFVLVIEKEFFFRVKVCGGGLFLAIV